jgi:type II secretory pathway pseudopilin PulG
MKRAHVGHRGAVRGFTLVELLLVMGIIVMLVGLLFPAVNAAVTAVRTAATQTTINNLSAGLEAFKQDWGMYPPSETNKDGWTGTDGYYALIWYLMGSKGTGWGSLAVTVSGDQPLGPFGGTASVAYGPYYKITAASPGLPEPVQDAFRPGKAIFYYRYDLGYDWQCNHGNGTIGDTNGANFYSELCFQLLAKPLAPDPNVAAGSQQWVRKDYLLISAGPDRYWGYVKEVSATGGPKVSQDVTQSDINSGVAMCDDVCNFKY